MRRAVRSLAAAVVVGGATGIWLIARRARRARGGDVAVQGSSRVARSLGVARLGGRTGSAYAVHRARRVFADAERRQELDARFQLRTAEEVTAALGNMKGALMKIGQMASYLDQGLPEPMRQTLAELLQDAPPMSGGLAADVVERELGAAPDVRFAEWDETPIAAASIGQVHRAITHDGVAVAVKVQYPGIAEAVRADLDNADLLFTAMGMMFPGLDPAPLVEELRARLVEELDYRTEAANQKLFAGYYADHPFIHIPAVIDSLSTELVLTTELATGARFSEVERWERSERDLAGEAIYRFVFRSLYRLHAFNGDPHPGNYLFRPGGRVTFLDFGLVKRFRDPEIAVFQAMIQAVVYDHDLARYRSILAEIGLLRDGARFSDEQIEEYFGHFYEFVRGDGPFTITPEWSSGVVRRFFDVSGPYGEVAKAANLPPSFLIIQRINLGLGAVLGELRVTRNWRRIAEELWPWIDAPPSTGLGEEEAAWLRSHPRSATPPSRPMPNLRR